MAVTESEPSAVYAVGTTSDAKNSSGGSDVLVVKFNAYNGNVAWVQLLGYANSDRGDDLAIDLLTSQLCILGTINLPDGDLYIAKIQSSDGYYLGAIHLDQGYDYSLSMAINPGNGSLWVSGQTQTCAVLWGIGPNLSWDYRQTYCGAAGTSAASSIMCRNNLLYVAGATTDSFWNGTANHGSVSTSDIIFSVFSVNGTLMDFVLLGTPSQEVTPAGAFWMDSNTNPAGYIVGSTSGNYGGYNQGGLDMFLTIATPCNPCVSPTPTPSVSPSGVVTTFAQHSTSFTKSSLFYPIIGAGGGLLLIIAVILVVFIIRKRRNRESDQKPFNNNESGVSTESRHSGVQRMIFFDCTQATVQNYSPHGSTNTAYAPIRSSTLPSSSPPPLPARGSANTLTFQSSSVRGHDWIINYSEIKFDKKIGEGAFGEVFKGTWRGINVAIKRVILPEDPENADVKIQDFFAEAELMKSLRPHPNITQLLGVVAEPYCIVTEFVENGSLDRWLSSGKPMDDNRKMKVTRGIAIGMHHLHSEGVIHRDLAARNILLDKTLSPKVSDFGLSRVVFNKQTQKTDATTGPIRWMAPEALSQMIYNTKTDVWSFGCVVYEILTRKAPYYQYNVMQVGTCVCLGKMSLVPEIEENQQDYAPVLVEILKACLRYDPEERPDFEVLMDWLGDQ